MTTRTPRDQTLLLLEALGDTIPDIRNNLGRLGIKGARQRYRACPIARYLYGNGIPIRAVTHTRAELMNPKTLRSLSSAVMPPVVREFIEAFDHGQFQELDEAVHVGFDRGANG